MARYENDRRMIALRDLPLQVESVDIRQLDIEDQARREVGLRIGDIVGGRCERLGSPPKGLQQLPDRLADPEVVIHHEDDLPVWAHGAVLAAVNRVPVSGTSR